MMGAPPSYAAVASELMAKPTIRARAEALRRYNIVFIIDDSGSMEGSYWNEVKEALPTIARVAATYDDDGIDAYFLNRTSDALGNEVEGQAPNGYYNLSADELMQLFDQKPEGRTPTGSRVSKIGGCYIDAYQKHSHDAEPLKPLLVVVITDGNQTDKGIFPLERVIVDQARRLDGLNAPPRQLVYQFIQIGDLDAAKTELKYLDNDLQKKHGLRRDCVDAKSCEEVEANGGFNAETVLLFLLGAIDEAYDNL